MRAIRPTGHQQFVGFSSPAHRQPLFWCFPKLQEQVCDVILPRCNSSSWLYLLGVTNSLTSRWLLVCSSGDFNGLGVSATSPCDISGEHRATATHVRSLSWEDKTVGVFQEQQCHTTRAFQYQRHPSDSRWDSGLTTPNWSASKASSSERILNKPCKVTGLEAQQLIFLNCFLN